MRKVFGGPEKRHLRLSLDGEVTEERKFDFSRRFLPHSCFRDQKSNFPRQIFHPTAILFVLNVLTISVLQKHNLLLGTF